MTKLHWIVFVITGLILTFGSWMINRERFVLFFYAGFVFLLIGIVKFIYKKNKMPNKPTYPNIKHCPRCRAPLRLDASFCYNCGGRV